jgi:hypothetical protein
MIRRTPAVVASLGLAAAAVLVPAGPASAYPPGMSMYVTASPSTAYVGQRVTATAKNVAPGCSVKFYLDGNSRIVASSGGTASTSLRLPSTAGRYSIIAATVGCSVSERSSTQVRALPLETTKPAPRVNAPSKVARLKVFPVYAWNFAPYKKVTIRISKAGVTLIQSKTANRLGKVTMYFGLSRVGTYSVLATQGRKSARDTLVVYRP